MKIDNRYIGKLLLLVLLLAIKGNLFAQNSGYDDQGKEILSKDTPRRALVAPDCIVNTMWDLVSVAGEENGMNNFLDSDLNNSVKLRSLLGVDAIESELIRVKDRKHVYEKGTPVGFSLEISGGLLDLSVLKIFNILYYYKGELVGSATASDGGEGGGLLDLNLIQLSSDAATMITATDPNNFKGEYFDEIGLAVGGLDVDLLSSLGIRYAFAGAVQEVTLTQNNEKDLGTVSIVTGGGWLGTEYTYNVSSSDHFIDEDLNNTTPAAVSDLVGSSITVKWGKTFPAGTEVGFLYSKTELLTVGLGKVGSITLYDENGGETEEIVLNASVIGLGLLKSEKHASSVIASKPFCQARFRFTGGLKLSETTYYYGFLREAPIIPQSCQITDLAMDASVCGSETEYQLSPTNGVKWSLEKVTADKAGNVILDVSVEEKGKVKISEGKVTGISPDVEGYYHFKAVNEAECEGWFVLRHGVQASTGSCNDPVKGSEYDLAPARNAEGGIMILNNIKNRNNIIDDDPNNYAEIQPGITLLSNDFVVGVQKKDGIISDGQESKRVGFLVDIPTSLLDVNALQFFYIKLYNEGKPVGKNTYTVEDWNVISAGLIGSEKASKTRLGVTVPSDVVFDEFSLWTGGVGSIRLSALRIYGALVENGSDECDNPLLGCDDAVIVGDGALDKAYINYDRTGFPALTNLGVGLYGLENLLSGEFDPSKYAYSYTTLDVAGTMQISIKFGRTLTPNHQVGFVVDKKTFLGNVGVIGVTQIKSYYSGSSNPDEPVDEKSDWSVLGADVIGYGDYAYLMFKPNAKFDEIQLITASGVGLLNSTKVYSVFIRTDADGDGIPDCMDPDSCTGDLTGLAVTKDVCVGDNILLSAIANFKNVDSKDYTLTVSDGTTNIYTETITIKNGLFEHYFKLDKAGQYTLTLTEVLGEGDTSSPNAYTLTFTVHPSETTWTPASSSTDWNAWGNWSDGSPWTCTDVIIPTEASVYPVLESGVLNGCHYIHFEPNTEVVNTHYLTYTKAWVEIELQPDRYYMVSAPLKGIYSGDWFIAENDVEVRKTKFQIWNESSYPENRINPTIYQRVWEAASANRLASGGYEGVYPNIPTTNWTKPFNLLSTEYNKNEGYDFNALSVWVHPFAPNVTTETPTDQDPYVFRFPKEHTKYYYYDENGVIQSPFETLKRENTGRFIYEDADSKFSGFPYYMKVRNIKTGDDHNVFLVGNPFMAHINVEKFLKENEFITSVKVYDGNTNNTIADSNGELLISSISNIQYSYIAPMQSFFVTMTTETPTGIILPDYCEVKFTEDMLVGKVGDEYKLKSVILNSDKSGDNIRISAEAEGKKAGALLRFTAEANDNFRDREDSEVLIEDEVPPTVAVFTVAEDYALDIQQRRNGGNIPLGLYMAKPADVTLRIDIPEQYSGWVVEDMETKRVYALRPGKENELRLGRMTTNVGRFYLKGESTTGNEVISASQPKISCYMESGSGKLKVRSYDGTMERCEVYSIDGSLRSVANFDSDEYSFPAYKGVNVVKVCFKDGIQTVRKVACF